MLDTYREKEQRGIRVTRFEDRHGEGWMEVHPPPSNWTWRHYDQGWSSGTHPVVFPGRDAYDKRGRRIDRPKSWWRRLREKFIGF
jgi:hypothetical protein